MEKPSLSKDSVSQTIDLEELTGLDLSDYQSLRDSIGQAIVDKIVERTQSGTGYNGRALKSPYSKEYQKSLEFKAAGKSARDVNMTLTGDMLGTLGVSSDDGSTVKIYVDADQAGKAYNHCVGDTVPKRNWFGVTKKDVSSILDDFSDDLDAIRMGASDDADSENSGKLKLLDLLNADDSESEDD